MIVLLFAFFTIAFIGLCYYLTFPPGTKELERFCGPPTEWIFGNALQFPTDIPGLSKLVMNWWKTYESPMKVKLMHKWYIYVYKAEHVEIILKDSKNITKSRDYDLLHPWLGNGLLNSTGDKWRYRRKLLTSAFHFQILKDFLPIFNEQAEVAVDILKEQKGAPIDICPFMIRLTLDIICETAMGKNLNSQRDINCEYADALDRFSEVFMHRMMRPWLWIPWIWNLTRRGQIYNQTIEKMQKFTREIIFEREKQNKTRKAKRLAFLDLLLQMKNEAKLDDEDVREEVDTFMFEGHDTTAYGLSWAIFCIGSHPEIQEELYKEILAVCGQSGDVTPTQLADLQLLDRVLKESQRLYPSVPLIARETTDPLELDGTEIPIGTPIFIIKFALHRDPEVFPEPLKFDPDRFLPEEILQRHPFAFAPFSAGPRNCIGQKFALMEEKIVLVHLIRNFFIESMQKENEIQPAIQMILRPTDGIWVKLKQRSL